MPSTPYAKVLASINGAANTSGGLAVANGDTIQLSPESTVGWKMETPPEWQLYSFTTGFSAPAGWSTKSVAQPNGTTATVYYYLGATPPVFSIPAATWWGKILGKLLVDGATSGTLTDDTTAFEAVSPNGLHDTVWLEETQFGSARKWIKHVSDNWRAIEALFAAFVADATVTATANKILRRGSSAEAKAAWIESGTGTPAGSGLVRPANNTVVWASKGAGAYDVPGVTVNASDVHVHGDGTRTAGYELRAKTGGLWKWFVNAAEILRLTATQILFAHDVAGPALKQAQRADNAACSDLTVESQTPFVGATGANRDPGDVVLKVPAPEAGGAAGKVSCVVSGAETFAVGDGHVDINGGGATIGEVRLQNEDGLVWKGAIADNVPGIHVDSSDHVVVGHDDYAAGVDLLVATGGGVDVSVDGTKVVTLDAGGVATDIVREQTAAAGVTVDGLLIKDAHLPAKYRWREERWQKEDDATAGTTTTPRPFATFKYACTVTDINYRAHDALTADNTDNVTITVYAYTDAGVLVGKVAEYISNVATGGLASEVPKDFGAITNAACAAGYGLAVAIGKGGSGKIVPAGVLTVNTTLD